MNDKIFCDTNVIIYLYSEDEPDKNRKCNLLLREAKGLISTQVLNETVNTLRKKFQTPYPAISKVIEELSSHFEVVTVTPSIIQSALVIASRYDYSYYDSLILATALENNCTVVYSEDMQHGQTIENRLRIINPLA